METKKSNLLKIILYVFYGMVFFAFITIWRFPYHLLTTQINSFIEKQMPSASVSFKKISPSFPSGATFQNVKVGYYQTEVINFDAVDANLDLWPITTLLNKHYPVNFNAKGPAGRISGQTVISQTGTNAKLELRSKIERLDLKKIAALQNLKSWSLAGIIKGTMSANLSLGNKKINKGDFTMNLPEGVFTDLNIMGIKIPRLDYERITSQLTLEDQKITVKQMELVGKEVNLSTTGDIILNQNLSQSNLNLSLRLKPSPNLLKELGIPAAFLKKGKDKDAPITVKISGTFSQPRVEF